MKYATLLLVLAILVVLAVAARAGDYMLYKCGSIRVMWSIPSEASQREGATDGFYEYKGKFPVSKELPKRLFRVKTSPERQAVYYRGKLCTEIED